MMFNNRRYAAVVQEYASAVMSTADNSGSEMMWRRYAWRLVTGADRPCQLFSGNRILVAPADVNIAQIAYPHLYRLRGWTERIES